MAQSGVPENPGAWLMTVARRRAIDLFRRRPRRARKEAEIGHEMDARLEAATPDLDAAIDDPVGDDLLRLVFVACHPVLAPDARVALTLRLLGGLTTAEIARAFLVPEPTVAQRIVRAKRTLAEARVPFEVPRGAELTARLSSVLGVIYLIYNEGFTATAGDDWMRPSLCEDALRLGRILAELVPAEPEAHGLVALMEIQASRARARIGPGGEPILLLDQDRARWDYLLIRRGLAALERAEALGGALGPYALQAAIAACHARARTPRGHRLGPHRGAVRRARRAVALSGGRAQSRGCGLDDVRAGGGAGARRCPRGRSQRSRATISCRACVAISWPGSAALTRPGRSSSAPPRSRGMRASATSCWVAPLQPGMSGDEAQLLEGGADLRRRVRGGRADWGLGRLPLRRVCRRCASGHLDPLLHV